MYVAKRQSAQSLIEVTLGIVILVPIILLILDLSLILWGVQANALTCRNAVRAAASGDPVNAGQRAQSVVERQDGRSSSTLISNSVVVPPIEVKIINSPTAQPDAISGQLINPGGPIDGTISVTTSVEIKGFILQAFFSKQNPLRFSSRETFPITFVVRPDTPKNDDQEPRETGSNAGGQPL